MNIKNLEANFIEWFNDFSSRIADWADGKGFWHQGQERNDAEQIALMHSELSEALEWLRADPKPSDHIPEFLGIEEELADVVIRVMDYAAHRKYRVAEAIVAKMNYNETRPHRHGKKF